MPETELTPSVPVTPSEEPAAVVPADEPAAVVDEPAVEAPKLYKLPDGREVDAEGLKAEYENLLPEFTRRSQELAQLKGKPDDIPEWKKEGYTPKSYSELIELGKAEALKEIAAREQSEAIARAEISAQVDSAVAALKVKDPKLDENALFAHANKYGFRDLKLAYENMAEIKKIATVTEERVLKGAAKKIDPIATGSGSGSGSAIRYPQASSATEFLSRLKTK